MTLSSFEVVDALNDKAMAPVMSRRMKLPNAPVVSNCNVHLDHPVHRVSMENQALTGYPVGRVSRVWMASMYLWNQNRHSPV